MGADQLVRRGGVEPPSRGSATKKEGQAHGGSHEPRQTSIYPLHLTDRSRSCWVRKVFCLGRLRGKKRACHSLKLIALLTNSRLLYCRHLLRSDQIYPHAQQACALLRSHRLNTRGSWVQVPPTRLGPVRNGSRVPDIWIISHSRNNFACSILSRVSPGPACTSESQHSKYKSQCVVLAERSRLQFLCSKD